MDRHISPPFAALPPTQGDLRVVVHQQSAFSAEGVAAAFREQRSRRARGPRPTPTCPRVASGGTHVPRCCASRIAPLGVQYPRYQNLSLLQCFAPETKYFPPKVLPAQFFFPPTTITRCAQWGRHKRVFAFAFSAFPNFSKSQFGVSLEGTLFLVFIF